MRSKPNLIKAGDLDKRIAIQSVARTTDSQGGYTEVWAAITGGTRWANIEEISGREIWRGEQLEATITHRITIRYLSTVAAKMRVLVGSEVFRIHAVRNPGRLGNMMVLDCEEVPA